MRKFNKIGWSVLAALIIGGGGLALAVPPVKIWGVNGTSLHSASNPVGVLLHVAGAAMSATNPIFAAPDGVAQANITCASANIANASTTVTLDAASTHVVFKTDPAAAICYVNWKNTTATSSNFRVEPGAALVYDGQAISAFKYIGATSTGVYSVQGN